MVRRAAFVLLLAALGLAAWLVARPPEGTDAPKPGTPPREAPPPPTPPRPPPDAHAATFTQILLLYRVEGGRTRDGKRTKAEAFELARDLIRRIRAGESMETLVLRHTDDLDDRGKPFNDGSYSLADTSPALPAVKRAAFGTRIGQVCPDPVDTGFGYVVIRRDH